MLGRRRRVWLAPLALRGCERVMLSASPRRLLTTMAWFTGCILLALAALVATGAVYAPMSLFADATPLVFALSCAALVAVLVTPADRRARATIALATGLIGVVLAPDTLALVAQRATAHGSDNVLKVVTANLWSVNPVHQPFLTFIAKEDPDVIVAVEVYKGWKPTLDSMAPRYRIIAGCLQPHECDVVILSKLATGKQFGPALSSRVTARLELPDRLGGQSFEVMGVHLSRPPLWSGSRPDMDAAEAAATSFGPLAFIAGDFNATSWSAPLRTFDSRVDLVRQTRWVLTWPTPQKGIGAVKFRPPFALAPIDHIYAGRDWRLVDIRRGPDIGSDHHPVVATFARNAP